MTALSYTAAKGQGGAMPVAHPTHLFSREGGSPGLPSTTGVALPGSGFPPAREHKLEYTHLITRKDSNVDTLDIRVPALSTTLKFLNIRGGL